MKDDVLEREALSTDIHAISVDRIPEGHRICQILMG
jgi:hypothetical protein